MIRATLKVGRDVFDANGATVIDALESLPLIKPKSFGILSISDGEITVEKIINVRALTRLFSPSTLTRTVQIKNTSLLFGL